MDLASLSYLEGPRDDETLGSMLGRALDRAPIRSKRAIGQLLFGQYGVRFHLDLPKRMEALANTFGRRLGLSATELIEKTTILPMLRPFLSPADLESLLLAMRIANQPSPSSLIAIQHERGDKIRYFRFCERCARRDKNEHGFSWWRRSHQVRGVYCCPRCKTALAISHFQAGQIWSSDYPIIEDAKVVSHEQPIDDLAIHIAKETEYLLSHEIPAVGPLPLRDVYMQALKTKGLVRDGRLARYDFLEELSIKLMPGLKQRSIAFEKTNPYAWPAALVLGKNNRYRPLRHLCIMFYLGLNVKDVFTFAQETSRPKYQPSTRVADRRKIRLLKILWANRSISINAIARSLEVVPSTVVRWATTEHLPWPRIESPGEAKWLFSHRESLRNEWLRVRNGGERKHRARVRHWLSTYDAGWFKVNHTPPSRKGTSTVDWDARDREIASKIPYFASRIRAQQPMRRITTSNLSRLFRNGHALMCTPRRMPLTEKATQAVLETHRDFVLRKIATFRKRFPSAPPHRIRDLAAVPRVFTDQEMLHAMGYTHFKGDIHPLARKYDRARRKEHHRQRWGI
ncbi:MAG: TnsD family Tn7-like transposition protein [Nibricoccus sp.]